MRIVEPILRSLPIPPPMRWLHGSGPHYKEDGGFFSCFVEADQGDCIPRAISRRQERQRLEAENRLYPNFMFGVGSGPNH